MNTFTSCNFFIKTSKGLDIIYFLRPILLNQSVNIICCHIIVVYLIKSLIINKNIIPNADKGSLGRMYIFPIPNMKTNI